MSRCPRPPGVITPRVPPSSCAAGRGSASALPPRGLASGLCWPQLCRWARRRQPRWQGPSPVPGVPAGSPPASCFPRSRPGTEEDPRSSRSPAAAPCPVPSRSPLRLLHVEQGRAALAPPVLTFGRLQHRPAPRGAKSPGWVRALVSLRTPPAQGGPPGDEGQACRLAGQCHEHRPCPHSSGTREAQLAWVRLILSPVAPSERSGPVPVTGLSAPSPLCSLARACSLSRSQRGRCWAHPSFLYHPAVLALSWGSRAALPRAPSPRSPAPRSPP